MHVNLGNVAGRYFLSITSIPFIVRVSNDVSNLFTSVFEAIDANHANARLGSITARHRLAVVADTMIVEQGLEQGLASYEFPIALLDFETVTLPVRV